MARANDDEIWLVVADKSQGRADTHHDYKTWDIHEKQILVKVSGIPQEWEHTILFGRTKECTFITYDSDGVLRPENLENERLVPLAANSEYPLEERPFRVLKIPDAATLAKLRADAWNRFIRNALLRR